MHDRRIRLSPSSSRRRCCSCPSRAMPRASTALSADTVTDPSGSPVPGAEMVLKNTATGVELERTSGADGGYAFRNLLPGTYELQVTLAGFQPYLRSGIEVRLNGDVRLDVSLTLGGQTEQVEVAAASALSYDSGSHEDGIAPDTLQQLPLDVHVRPALLGHVRAAHARRHVRRHANAFDARINGGLQSGDEAVLDGASMQQGFMSQSGMVSIFQDFPFSPDMVSEIKVVSSSYDAQYGVDHRGPDRRPSRSPARTSSTARSSSTPSTTP